MAFIIVNGRLGSKPIKKQSHNGRIYIAFSLAYNEWVREREETVWCNCIWLGYKYNPLSSKLDKGSAVCIAGKLAKPNAFQRKDGSWDASLTILVSDISFCPLGRSMRSP